MNDRDCENCKHHTEKGCDSWDCNFERRMTREEAIKQLKTDGCYECAYGCENVVDCTAKGCKYKEAFLMAINSLEIDERYELEYEQIEQKTDVLDKIRTKIAEYGSIWVVYEITDKTKTDKGIEKLVSDVLSQAKEQVLDIIDKYKAESEG